MNPGPGRSGAPAPPAPALIHLKKNNGIEPLPAEEKTESETKAAVTSMILGLPGNVRKKMFALQSRIEAMAKTYGLDHIGMQTLTIRENITDGKEFNKRFKSISTNIFPKLYAAWIRVYERQQRGAWHVHVVVATKADIRGGSDPAALNRLFQDKRDRKIIKALYYAGIQRNASPNLRAIWKEFRRVCALREFKHRRKSKRYYKFDASHLLPIISTPQALAVYVSKYLGKGFQHRRSEDKGMRLVGCSKNVSRICSEHFSWADGAGRVWRLKLGALAGMFAFASEEDFAKALGKHWAYHLRPAVDILVLPHYATMREARADGWDLVNKADGSLWPWPDLTLPPEHVQRARIEAYKLVRQLIDRRRPKLRRRSRVERGWDPERWEHPPERKREYKYFKPPAKQRVLCQMSF
ncbi:MAG TPA: hypothetical protein VGO67_06860 [Verrucomicrobiae bacterium]|jgi:hypothetical protein